MQLWVRSRGAKVRPMAGLSEHGEKVDRRGKSEEIEGFSLPECGFGTGSPTEGGELFKAVALLLKSVEFAIGVEERTGVAMQRVGLPHHYQPVRMLVGERAQEYPFDEAEDGGVGADAEREGEHSHEGEA